MKMHCQIIQVVLLMFISNVCYITAYQFLIYPINAESHRLVFAKFAAALTEQNHTADMLIPSNARMQFKMDPSISIIRYPVRFEHSIHDTENASKIEEALTALKYGYIQTAKVVLKQIDDLMEFYRAECEDLLQNEILMDKLVQNKYDLLILDSFDTACAPVLPYKLGLPIAVLTSGGIYWYNRIPLLPSVAPHLILPFSEKMTFYERFLNFIVFCVIENNIINFYDNDYYVRKYAPDKPPVPTSEIIRGTLIYFYRHYDLLQFPLPKMPNIIQVGDLTVQEPFDLSDEYDFILDTSITDVIVFSIGSIFKEMPEDLVRKFCDAFRMLPTSILVIWKSDAIPYCPENVITKPWLPQNDLLGHPKISLFITHCGVKSYIESAYHGKPMIGFPILMDQLGNCANMEERGLGICMDITSFEPHELVDSINIVLNNNTFKDSASKYSQLMHNQQFSAKEKVVFWTEHVLKFGGDHLRSSGFDMSLFQFLMVDNLGVLFLVIVLALLVCWICLHGLFICLCQFCRRNNATNKTKQD